MDNILKMGFYAFSMIFAIAQFVAIIGIISSFAEMLRYV